MTAPLPPDSDARLAALEEAVAALRAEVASLRATPPAAATPSVAPVAHARAAAPATYADLPRAPRTQAPGSAARLGAATRTWATGLGLPEFPTERADLETLIGRYGAVAVGALVLLMGVGAFLTWAVANFTLAPATRVVLGAIGAAALATLGEWLRRRPGAQRFGEVLLALALAVLHVDAWAAGPYLHLVSAPAALGAAAAASGALTALAWRARQQSLFVVGVGGALLAPFVSGAGDVEPFVRPIYGWLVLGAGLIALVHGSEARRPWRAASRLLALGTSLYALAQLDAGLGVRAAAGTADRWLRPAAFVPDLPAAFTLACAATSLAALVWARRTGATGQATAASPDPAAPTGSDAPAVRALLVELTLAQLTTATVVLWATAAATLHERPTLFGCALLTLIGAQLVAVLATPEPATLPATARPARRGRGLPVAALAGLVLPLGTLAAALAGLDRLGTPAAAVTALLWSGISGLAAFAGWRRATDREPDVQFGPHLAAASIAGALALVLWTREHDALRLALLGIYGALSSLLFARLPRTTRADAGQTGTRTRDRRPLLALAPPLLTLTGASLWGAVLLHARAAYAYTPFLTSPSFGAATVVLGWAACARVVWAVPDARLPRVERVGVVAVAFGVALLWGREELARAVAPDVATFLLVGYFATVGLAVLAFGRARHLALARQTGLALALYAALKAIVEVSQLDAVALRVGSYLLVGGFLLGVGYWYRGSTEREPAAALPPAV